MGVQNIYSVFGGRHFRYFRRGLSFLLVPTKNLQNYQFEGGSSQFLAAMSSSRSDVVTQSVRSLVMKEIFFSLRSYKGVSWKPKGCFNEVSRMIHASFMDRKLQGCFKKVSRVL